MFPEFDIRDLHPEIVRYILQVFGTSFLFSGLVVLLTPRILKRVSRSGDMTAVQSAHAREVVRLGGVGLILGLMTCLVDYSFSDPRFNSLLMICASAFPIMVVGFLEDTGNHIAPRTRLIFIALSSLVAILVLDHTVTRVGVYGIDTILSIWLCSVLFTIFGTVGVVNAFNLIDGLNGLASFTALFAALCLSWIAFSVGEFEIVASTLLIAMALIGFLFWNFPSGRIFLGDGGAYFLGHFLVWSAIVIVNSDMQVSAFAILLVFFWPVADTVLAIWRRKVLSTPHDRPDRLHFHQLVMRFLEKRIFGRGRRHIANPVATLVLLPFILAPQLAGVYFATNQTGAIGALCGFSLLFFMTYILGMRFARVMQGRKAALSYEDRESVAVE